MSLSGVVRLRWQDVSAVTAKQMGLLVLSDGNSSVTIALLAYDSPRAVKSWIRDRVAETRKADESLGKRGLSLF